MKLEKNGLNEMLVKYCVRCLSGRIALIAFVDEVEILLSSPAIFLIDDSYEHSIVQGIDHRIKYHYHTTGKITFDFGDVTIKEFIGMLETIQVHVTYYGLLSFQNLSALFKACKEKGIKIIGMKTGSIHNIMVIHKKYSRFKVKTIDSNKKELTFYKLIQPFDAKAIRYTIN